VADSEPVTAAQARPTVVRLPTEIDMTNADSIGEQLGTASAPGVPVVIADMTATTFCDSAGINMLIRASKRGAANGTELRLLRTCPSVLRIMRIQGVDAVIPIYQNLEEALASRLG